MPLPRPVRLFTRPCVRRTSASQAREPDSPSGSRSMTPIDPLRHPCRKFGSNLATPLIPTLVASSLAAPTASRASRRLPRSSTPQSSLSLLLRTRRSTLQRSFVMRILGMAHDSRANRRPIHMMFCMRMRDKRTWLWTGGGLGAGN